MKKILLLSIGLTLSVITLASDLFLLPTGSVKKTKSAFAERSFVIHFFNDVFLIGSTDGSQPENSILLDRNAWSNPSDHYYLLYTPADSKEQYRNSVLQNSFVLYETADFIVVKANQQQSAQLFPAIHGGMICISQQPAKFPASSLNYKPGSLVFRDYISDMIELVNSDSLEAFVQHLQDFGTRNAYKAGSIAAQDWIFEKFQSFGLDVELHDFTMPNGAASDNVIATLPGTVYPDEYVILGAHYDSYVSGTSNEPGADDNASGAAGILEAARIMSQYQFDRTIIFATWSGEEYGLYGSGAWASEAADDGMNILGYFNIDMAGYLATGEAIHTDIIAPSSANELRQFYKDVCAIYLPDFQTFNGSLSGGDSDHTSFNNNGFQGIFPFEDVQNYSPYIHTSNDLIGPSVNNFEQVHTFVQAIIANVATMSSQLPVPENLAALAGDQQVDLTWEAVAGISSYNIYKNSEPEPYANTIETAFTDIDVVNGTSYSYYVTAIFEDSGEESGPSNVVTAIPMPPISLPFLDDFETGAPYWTMDSPWGLQTGTYHSSENALSDSPSGNYQANLDISATLRSLDLTGAASAQLSFWTRFVLEPDYDYVYLEISTDGSSWEQLDVLNGSQANWVRKTYLLDDYLGQSNVIIRYRFTSDVYVEYDGIYIDDFEVFVSGVGVKEDITCTYKTNLQFSPNPASGRATLDYWLENSGPVKISLTDSQGNIIQIFTDTWKETGSHRIEFETKGLAAGVYLGILEFNGRKITKKLVVMQ